VTRRLMKTIFFVFLVLALAACGAEAQPSATPVPATPTPSPAPTSPPPQALTICIGEEPSSLYPYGSLTSAGREVLAAIYDGPIDIHDYSYHPVILEKLPSSADGDALVETVSVYIGDEVVDAEGKPVQLQVGVRIRPAGCRADDCAVVYDGVGAIEMDQMVVNFRMLPDLLWSDGTQLTAEDSLYSYNLAADPETIGSKYLYERTQSYEATDDRSVQWWGKPGFIDPTYFTNFWMPLPRHLWQDFNAADLPNTDVASVFPVGWGPYMIADWIPGDSIRMVRNPNYFRIDEGLPYFDELVYRFALDPNQAISMLLAGQCDLLAPSVPLDYQVSLLLTMESSGLLQAEFSQSMVMEHLAFGVRPAGYDDGFSLLAGDRPDLLGDARMRQAIAMCVDRQGIVDSVLSGLTSVPDSLLPAGHPLYDLSITTYPYNLTQANLLLEQVGWKDDDNDPTTPRLARNVTGVFDGTRLEFDLWTSDSFQRRQVSQLVADSLAQCGIGITLHYESLEALYAPGPDGLLRGRQFELVEVAMGSLGMDPVCEWFLGSEIPSAENDWGGINFGGYDNPEYDAACYTAMASLQDDDVYAAAYREIQAIFSEDLPVLPLYWRIQAAAARPDLCNFRLDPVVASNLYNLESYGYGVMCSP